MRALSPQHQAKVKRARKAHCALVARALQIHAQRKVHAHAVACIISHQTAKETTCMHCPSYAVS